MFMIRLVSGREGPRLVLWVAHWPEQAPGHCSGERHRNNHSTEIRPSVLLKVVPVIV
jgi:hypothetical protein